MAGLTAPPDNAELIGQVIEADGWFPGIDTAQVRASVRLGDGIVTDDRLREAVLAGMLAGLRQLADWRSARALEGKAKLDDVTADQLGGENLAVLLWRRVVTYYAAAEILDGHTDVAATDDALNREAEKRDTADTYRRKGHEAVADLRAVGLPDGAPEPHGRNRVDLI